MSRACENCSRRIHQPSFRAEQILRQDPLTGYTCKFCSDECVREWATRRKEFASELMADVVPAIPVENAALAMWPADSVVLR